MKPTSPLAKVQVETLTQLRALGVCTDESLSTFLRALGQPCSVSVLRKYRQGRRSAPLALLVFILQHCTLGERIAVLNLFAWPLGLRVVPRLEPVVPAAIGDELEPSAELVVLRKAA